MFQGSSNNLIFNSMRLEKQKTILTFSRTCTTLSGVSVRISVALMKRSKTVDLVVIRFTIGTQ